MDQTLNTTVELGTTSEVKTIPAGFWVRFGAFVIDAIVLGLIQAPLSIIQAIFAGSTGAMSVNGEATGEMVGLQLIVMLISYAVAFGVGILYYGFFYSRKGATPGKMVFSLKVIDTDTGKNLGFWKAAFRDTLGKLVSSIVFMVGYLMAAFRKDKKALHDVMFNSQVLKVKK